MFSLGLFARLRGMKLLRLLSLGFVVLGLASCFDKKTDEPASREKVVKVVAPLEPSAKDKSLEVLTRYLAEADGIHREAWWVLNAYRPPMGKSPFGKVQRALLSSQNIKLTNKSLFRCDRYLVKRDILGVVGYPQKAEVFEKCSEKSEARRIASLDMPKEGELNLIFYPDQLQEVLGLAASILNKSIHCSLRGKDKLESLSCRDWAQDRTQGQMIRLEVYEYQKSGGNLLRLRGKVMENLAEIRKIEAVVPLEGKISVVETELYAPEEPAIVKPSPTPVAKPTPGRTSPGSAHLREGEVPSETERAPVPVATPETSAEILDPDVLMQQQQIQQNQESSPEDPTMEGWPSEGPVPIEQQDSAAPQEIQPQPEGAPRGR